MTWIAGVMFSSVAGAQTAAELAPQMHERFAQLEAMRSAVIDGKTAAAKAAAKKIARTSGDGLPAAWNARVAAVREAALAAASAADLSQAAEGAARIAVACSGCHAEMDGGPDRAQLAAIPAQGWTEGTNMQLHDWATDVMWFGLLAPDDEVWKSGASELASEPIALRFREPPLQEGRTELELRLYVLAGAARELATADEKAVLYGQMIATCAECHAAHR